MARHGKTSGKSTSKSMPQSSGKGSAEPAVPPVSPEALDRLVPTWLPPVLYAVVTVVLFRTFIFSDGMLQGGDTLSLGYAAREFYAQALRDGYFPLWNPYILGGAPFVEALSGGDAIYPTSVLPLFMETYRALGWKLILHIFAAGLFMFGWIRCLGGSRPAALITGLAYLMAPFMVAFVHPGHDGKIFVTALTPLLFWTLEWAFRKGGWAPFLLFAAEVALVIFTTHFQMAYFLFGALGVYAAFRAIQIGREAGSFAPGVRVYGIFMGASVLGAGVAGVQLLPAFDYVNTLSRRTATTIQAEAEAGVAYSSSWSLHPEELLSFVVPEFAGNNARGTPWADGTYWGRNFTKDNHEYAGVVILLLAGVGLFGSNRKALKLFLLSVGVLALLYALGRNTPVWRIFYEVVPGVPLFRVPSISSFLFGFAMITLAAFGIDRIFRWAADGWNREKGLERYLVGAPALLLVGTLLAASGVLLSLWRAVVYRDFPLELEPVLNAAEPFITQGFLFSTLFVGGAAGAVWLFRKGLLRPSGVMIVFVALVAIDAGRIDSVFIKTVPFEDWFSPDPNAQYILQETAGSDEPFRVFAAGGVFGFGQDVAPSVHGLELVAGHHPNDLARYRELIGMVGSNAPENLINANVLQILNVRYIIWPDYQFQMPWEELPRLAGTSIQGRPYEGLYAFPGLDRARLIGRATVLSDEETVPYILSPQFNPVTDVVLAEEPQGITLPGEPVQGIVEWIERHPNRLRLRVRADSDALLLLAENWTPAWRATVDGVDTPVMRANHVLRAIPLSAGEHTVELDYRSSSLSRGLWVSVLSVLLLLGGAIAARFVAARGEPDPLAEA